MKGKLTVTLTAELRINQEVSPTAVRAKLVGANYALVVGSPNLPTSDVIIKDVEGLPPPKLCPHCKQEIE